MGPDDGAYSNAGPAGGAPLGQLQPHELEPSDSPAPHVEPTATEVGQRTVRGAVLLGARQGVSLLLSLIAGIVLARLLSPADFGVYVIVYLAYSVLSSFGDAGLAASLVRRPEPPSIVELRAIFAAQQAFIIGVVVAGWFTAPIVISAYGLSGSAMWLARLIMLAIVANSLGTISALNLERALRFDILGLIGMAQSVAFNVVAVSLAIAGLGIYSLGIALCAQAVVGTGLQLWRSPWRVGFAWRPRFVLAQLRFGIPYQGMSFVSLAKDSISPLFVGLFLSATAVGYVEWAGRLAAYSLLALFILSRLYLASFARLQHDRASMARFVDRVVWACNAVAAPVSLITLALAHPITVYVFGPKWEQALPVFYLLWCANIIVPTAGPLLGVLNALGRAGTAFAFTVTWMAATWLIGAPLIAWLGIVGYGVANIIVQLTNAMLVVVVKRELPLSLWSNVWRPWLLAGIATLVCLAAQLVAPVNGVPMLIVYAIGTLVLFAVLELLVERPRWRRVVELARARV